MKEVVLLNTSRDYYSIEEASNYSISVGELINELKEYDRDAKIVFSNDNGYTYGVIHYETIESQQVEGDEERLRNQTMEQIENLDMEYEDIEYERNLDLTELDAVYEDSEISDEEYRKQKEEINSKYDEYAKANREQRKELEKMLN